MPDEDPDEEERVSAVRSEEDGGRGSSAGTHEGTIEPHSQVDRHTGVTAPVRTIGATLAPLPFGAYRARPASAAPPRSLPAPYESPLQDEPDSARQGRRW